MEVSGAGDVLYTSSQVSSMSCMSRNRCKCTCCSVYSLGLFFFFPSWPTLLFLHFWEDIQAQLRWNLHRRKAFRISSRQLGTKTIGCTRCAWCWHRKEMPVRCRGNRCMLGAWLRHKCLAYFEAQLFHLLLAYQLRVVWNLYCVHINPYPVSSEHGSSLPNCLQIVLDECTLSTWCESFSLMEWWKFLPSFLFLFYYNY